MKIHLEVMGHSRDMYMDNVPLCGKAKRYDDGLALPASTRSRSPSNVTCKTCLVRMPAYLAALPAIAKPKE